MILSGYLAKHRVTADLPLTFSTRTTPVGVASAAVAGPPSATASNSIPQAEALSDESTQKIEVWVIEGAGLYRLASASLLMGRPKLLPSG